MSESEIKYEEIATATMEPDLHAGQNMDQIRPGWRAQFHTDMEDESGLPELILAAEHFPAGTKIKIEAPCCPNCGTVASQERHCLSGCGFDWQEWTKDQYS